MDLLIRLAVALLFGLLAYWLAGLFLLHSIAVLIGVIVGLVVFARDGVLLR